MGNGFPFLDVFILQCGGRLPDCKESLALNPFPSNSQPRCSLELCVLCSHQPATQAGWGPANPLLHNSLDSLPSWIQWELTALSIWSLREQLCVGCLHNHFSGPFKKYSVRYPYHSTESLSGSLYIFLTKKQNVSHDHGWMQPQGASDRPRCGNLIILGD